MYQIQLENLEMKHNFVAKHMNDVCKPAVMIDRKKDSKKGKQKHKVNYKKDLNRSF